MKQYTVIHERAGDNDSAYASDLPGCVTTGRTLEETRRNMQQAIEGHIAVLREFGEPVPEPSICSDRFAVAA
jgi:predicted RNase H-like HicB family nuclease